MPLDFDIMLGSSPPILSQSPIFSYFNSLATARAAAAAYGHFEDKISSTKSSGGHGHGHQQASRNHNNNNNHNNNHNNNSVVHHWMPDLGSSSGYQTTNNIGTNGHHHVHRNIFSGKTQVHHQHGVGGGFNAGHRTNSLPATLFSRPVLSVGGMGKDSRSRPTLEAPLRPCIIIRDMPSYDEAMGTQSEPTSPTKLKKRVVFADDKGLELEEVRVMKEPSSCPPRWSPDFLDLVVRGSGADSPDQPMWDPSFPQPAANYKEFRERLERENVALENVIVKSETEEISGTVKVRNLGFNKEVLVRWTADLWKTYEDVHCTYLPSGAEGTSVVNVFDTFHFCFKVPKAGKPGKDGKPLCRLDFCVCFRADTGEFWDNNKGTNFTLEAPLPKPPSPPPTVPVINGDFRSKKNNYLKAADALRAEVPSWSEFASWNHLTNDAPYW